MDLGSKTGRGNRMRKPHTAIVVFAALIGCSLAPNRVAPQELVSNPSAFYGKDVVLSGDVAWVDGKADFAFGGYMVCHLGSPPVGVVMTFPTGGDRDVDMRRGHGLTVTGKFQKEYHPTGPGEFALHNVVVARTVRNGNVP